MADPEVVIEVGRQAWRDGAPLPAWPSSARIDDDHFLYWLGYMLERGRDFFRRREMALYPDTIEPR